MRGHVRQSIDRYLELARVEKNKLRKVTTPCIDDHHLSLQDFEEKGKLHKEASKIVLKILFVARMCRLDLLWSVNDLARKVTKWTIARDKRLHRLVSYMDTTVDYVQTNFIGDYPEDCTLVLFCDVSFAGDVTDNSSSSGAV